MGIHGSVGRRSLEETTSPDNQTFTFPTVLFYCIQMWEAAFQFPTYKALYWTLLRHDPHCFTEAASLRRSFAWWCLTAWLCPQVDLWAVKDGQINTLSIPDRIRGSETCLYLHTAHPDTGHIFVPSQPFWVGCGEGARRRWHHAPLSQLATQRVTRRLQMMLFGI